MPMTVTIPDELASRLRPLADRLPHILELGLRAYHDEPSLFAGLNDVLETLARLPTPEEILALRPSPEAQERLSALLAKQKAGGLSADEAREWERFQYVEHLVRVAKARALKLKADRTS
jgi:hypothetical protein